MRWRRTRSFSTVIWLLIAAVDVAYIVFRCGFADASPFVDDVVWYGYLAFSLSLLAYPLYQFFVSDQKRIDRLRRCYGGLCRSCGYDLRELPHRCPECGRGRSRSSDGVGVHG